MIAVAV